MGVGEYVKCQLCVVGERVLRRMGFQDDIHFSRIPESPNEIEHATYSQLNGKLLCVEHRSEIAWVIASGPNRPLVYLGHPLRGNYSDNVKSATRWVRWLRRRTLWELNALVGCSYKAKPIISAPWLGAIEPDASTPGGRENALLECKQIVSVFDEFWVLSSFSEGIRIEAESAKVVRDLTHLGKVPPSPKKLVSILKGKFL